MIRITKGQEPAEWTEIKNTPGIDYDSAEKTALRQALFEEQGGLCGYCMRRISFASGVVSDTRIEHLQPRTVSLAEGNVAETLSYSNMILCCDGDIDHDGNTHCDNKKGEKPISFTPFDAAAMSTISYSSKDGSIKSSNKQYDNEIREVLNLNHVRLAANRKEVVKGLVMAMGRRRWKKSEIEHKIAYYSNRTADGLLHPYCGVAIWYLTKKLRQFG